MTGCFACTDDGHADRLQCSVLVSGQIDYIVVYLSLGKLQPHPSSTRVEETNIKSESPEGLSSEMYPEFVPFPIRDSLSVKITRTYVRHGTNECRFS